ncbi:hypothetical protein Tco_0794072 [Tanacetum coccineum]
MSSMELGVVLDLGCSFWLKKFDFSSILYREYDIAHLNSFLSLVFIVSENCLDTPYGDRCIRRIGLISLEFAIRSNQSGIITINLINCISLTDDQLCIRRIDNDANDDDPKTRGHSGDQGDGKNDGQGGQVGGQGREVNDGVDGVPDFSTIIAQQL